MGTDVVRLRRTADTWWSAASWGLIALVGLGLVAVGRPIVGGVVSTAAIVAIVRTLRAEVRVDDHDVLVRALLRTRVVALEDIESAASVRRGAGALRIVELRLRDGRRVRADSVGCSAPRQGDPWTDADAVVEAISQRCGGLADRADENRVGGDDPTPPST